MASTDGTGSSARFYQPQGVAVDSAGNVYVADTWNQTIRKVTPAGVVTTLAGVPGGYGNIDGTGSADGTNSRAVQRPRGRRGGQRGQCVCSDIFNHTIRKVTPAGVVSTLAGLAGRVGQCRRHEQRRAVLRASR